MAVKSLPSRHDFDSVFANPGARVSSRDFLVLAAPSTTTDSRIGFVTSKKKLRRAADRNRFRRCFREALRRQGGLPGIDLVIVARSTPPDLFSAAFSLTIEAALQKLSRKLNDLATQNL